MVKIHLQINHIYDKLHNKNPRGIPYEGRSFLNVQQFLQK